MFEGILRMYLVLMVVVGVNEPLQPSENNGIVPEDRAETLRRMKEREVTLWLHQLRLEKEIAELESRQEGLAQPALRLKRKIQRHTYTVLSLVVYVLLMLCRQHRQGATA